MTEPALSPTAAVAFPRWPRPVRTAAAAVIGVTAAVVVAYLVATGHPELAVGLLLVVPAAQVAVRYPLAGLCIWLVVAPFAVETSGGGMRMIFWLVHRGIPLAAVINILIAAAIGARPRLPRMTWAEAAMAAYVLTTQLSILYLSTGMMRPTFRLYDRVVVPMCLYLLVRFVQPDERHLRRLMPIVIFVLATQTLIGVLQWTAPGVLPGAWHDRIGLRSTGSLRHPSVFGTTMIFAAVLLLHAGISQRERFSGRLMLWLVPLPLVVVFTTYTRASWLAALVVVLGLLLLYPRYVTQLLVVILALSVTLILSGRVDAQIEQAQNRFLSERSEQSALSRLPMIAASIRMFQTKPLTGWGYDSFDEYDRQFQGAVGDLVVPEKDHASHNLYLTILAEQGLPGLLLYLGPFFYWLARSRTAWRFMPLHGLVSRRFLACLWLMLLSHVIVNNYANMKIEWGLGLWWLTLGMIASLVVRYDPEAIAMAARAEGDDSDTRDVQAVAR